MINGKLIKVCGMCHGDNIREVEELGADMIGFIFYPKSPRCMCELPDYMPQKAIRVGIFVNEERDTIEMVADRFGLQYIQLHGKESPAYCRALQAAGFKLIKAFPMATLTDLAAVYEYEGLCNYYLFDTKCEKHGGSGKQFDWSLLHNYTGRTPFLLSGGLNQYSSRALKEFNHHYLAGYDINSRFETAPGKKDPERIRFFLDGLQGKLHPDIY